MKKITLAALVAAVFPLSVLAEPNVSIYGGVDLGVLGQRTRGDSATVSMANGYSYASRFGFRGTEDLGNGYSVGFILEQGFKANTGVVDPAGNFAFSREAKLGFNGPFGQLAFGRLGTLGFFQSTGIIKGNVFGVTPINASSFNRQRLLSFARVDNAISYVTPSFGGLTVHLMYSNGTAGDEEKFAKNAHYYGVGAKLTRGPIDGSAIFEVMEQRGLSSGFYSTNIKGVSVSGIDSPIYHYTIGGSYDLKYVKPFAIYQFSHQSDYLNQHTFALGVSAPVAGGTLKGQARFIFGDYSGQTKEKLKEKGVGTDPMEWTLGVGYDYPFSKNTYLWTYGGYSGADKAWKKQPCTTDAQKAWNIMYNGWQLGAGLVHRF